MEKSPDTAAAKSFEAAEVVSPAEARFERRRRVVGFVVAPLAFALLLLLPLPGLKPEAHRPAVTAADHRATVCAFDLRG